MKNLKYYPIVTVTICLSVLIAWLSMVSCSEHDYQESYYGNISVGSVLLDDNQIVAIDGLDSLSLKHAIGVVIGTRSDSVWIVSSTDLGQHSYLDTLVSVSSVSSDLYELCGRENTAALLLADSRSDAALAVQTFNECSPVKGWFLPSIGELKMLSANLSLVSNIMNSINGDSFSTGQYLSSSQDGSSTDTEQMYAYCITLRTGYVSSILKTEKALVRPVIRLKIK